MRYRYFTVALIVTFNLLLSTILVFAEIWYPKPPRYISYKLAGIDIRKVLANNSDEYLYDERSGYVLCVSTAPGDERSLLLTKYSRLVKIGDIIPSADNINHVHLLALSTEKHVTIGSNPNQVLRILGLPTNHDNSTDGEPLRTGKGSFMYYYPGGQLKGFSYSARYDFEKGHLVTIDITIQRGKEVAG